MMCHLAHLERVERAFLDSRLQIKVESTNIMVKVIKRSCVQSRSMQKYTYGQESKEIAIYQQIDILTEDKDRSTRYIRAVPCNPLNRVSIVNMNIISYIVIFLHIYAIPYLCNSVNEPSRVSLKNIFCQHSRVPWDWYRGLFFIQPNTLAPLACVVKP